MYHGTGEHAAHEKLKDLEMEQEREKLKWYIRGAGRRGLYRKCISNSPSPAWIRPYNNEVCTTRGRLSEVQLVGLISSRIMKPITQSQQSKIEKGERKKTERKSQYPFISDPVSSSITIRQEAQLPQRDRATRYVSINSCYVSWARLYECYKGSILQKCQSSSGLFQGIVNGAIRYKPHMISYSKVQCNYVSILHRFRDRDVGRKSPIWTYPTSIWGPLENFAELLVSEN